MAFDTTVFQALYGLAGRSAAVDFVAVFLAQYLPYLLVAAFLISLFFERAWQKRFYSFALAALAVILSRGIIVAVIRFIYPRPRPFEVFGFEPLIEKVASPGFPSSHAAFFFALATSLFIMNRRSGIWFLVAAALMGVARVVVGVHWPVDIVAGAAVGIVSAILVRQFLHHRLKSSAREGGAE